MYVPRIKAGRDLSRVKGRSADTEGEGVKILLALLMTCFAHAQTAAPAKTAAAGGIPAHVQLDDVDIQGESNSEGLRLSQRDSNDIREKLHLRSDFLDRVAEEVPVGWRGPAGNTAK